MGQKALASAALRNVPEIFFCTFAQRRSRWAWLFVKGIRRSSSKASTCSARAMSASSRFLALLCLGLPFPFPEEEAAGFYFFGFLGGRDPTKDKSLRDMLFFHWLKKTTNTLT